MARSRRFVRYEWPGAAPWPDAPRPISAPQDLREQLRGLSSTQLITTAAQLRPGEDLAEPANATKYAMREIALRHQFLTAQLKRLDLALQPLVTAAAPPWWPAAQSAPTPPARCSGLGRRTSRSPHRARSRTSMCQSG
jgi:hypothetical protein